MLHWTWSVKLNYIEEIMDLSNADVCIEEKLHYFNVNVEQLGGSFF